jgi:hypothetical protein
MSKLEMVEIKWDDASCLEHGWVDPAEEKPVPQMVTTVGFLIATTDAHLVVAHTSDGSFVNGRFQIPRAMVRSIKQLRAVRATKEKSHVPADTVRRPAGRDHANLGGGAHKPEELRGGDGASAADGAKATGG